MEIEDIERFIIKNNINIKSRIPYHVDNRMYIYAILYHIHKWSLSQIGRYFNVHHSTVLHALKLADVRQSDELFIENCKEIQSIFFFVIPHYQVNSPKVEKPQPDVYTLKIQMNKKDYIRYLQTKNVYDIYDILWDLAVKQAKSNKK